MSVAGLMIFWIIWGGYAPLAAQEGDVLESFADTGEVSRSQLAALLESANQPVALENEESDALRADELAHVIMQLGSYGDNLGYRLFPGPRYAVRRLREERLYPDSSRLLPAGGPMDGTTVLRLIRPALTEAVQREPVQRDPVESETIEIATRALPGSTQGPWFEWNLEQTGGISYRSGETSATVATAGSLLDTQILFGPRAQFVTRLEASGTVRDDASDSVDLQIPRARLDLFRQPPGRGWTGSLSVGRIDDTAVVSDGIAARFSSATMISSFSVGYTGAVAASLNAIPGGSGQYSPERVVLHGDVLLPEVLGRQNPAAAVLSLVDLAETDALTQVRLGLSGPLGVSLFYDLSADVQFGTSWGWASRGSLRWYPETTQTTQLELSGAVAGSDRGKNQEYVALGEGAPWSAYPGAFTNIAATTVRYTARLGEPWLVSASSTLFNRVDADGSVEESVGPVTNSSALLGWESGLEVGIQLVPDLFFDINSNIFVPGTDAWNGAYADSSKRIWVTGIELTARL